MRSEEFASICQAVESGSERWVKHIVTHQVGKIVACGPEDFIEVETDSGEQKTWSKDNIKLMH